jgi:hypothetical protein
VNLTTRPAPLPHRASATNHGIILRRASSPLEVRSVLREIKGIGLICQEKAVCLTQKKDIEDDNLNLSTFLKGR